MSSSITGSSVVRAAGGTGSGYYYGAQTNGIGGGTPGVSGSVASRVGTINTGSGGGGGRSDAGQSGGSGIVIIRYPNTDDNITSIGAGLTYSLSNTGGYKIYTFTAGTGTVTF